MPAEPPEFGFRKNEERPGPLLRQYEDEHQHKNARADDKFFDHLTNEAPPQTDEM